MTALKEDRSTRLLAGHGLRKTYKLGKHNEVQALRGVEFAIDAGEMVAIMGPSGSGKSTLMHILGLLHAPDVDDGPRPELTFDGRDVVAVSDRERTRIRAREMGFVFQDFNLVPTLTALENVVLAADYAGMAARRDGPRPSRRSTGSGSPTGPRTGRPNSPEASSSGSRSRGPWSIGRVSCLPTSRPAISTRSDLARCLRCSGDPIESSGRRSSWSPTTARSAMRATASSGCAMA